MNAPDILGGVDHPLFLAPETVQMRADMALALRAAAHFGLGEGVCNHFSMALPDGVHFLLNPRGLMWAEVQADDVVVVDAEGAVVAGRHAVEPTAMFIHAAVHKVARKTCVLHTHMPYATALTLTQQRALDILQFKLDMLWSMLDAIEKGQAEIVSSGTSGRYSDRSGKGQVLHQATGRPLGSRPSTGCSR